MFGSLRWSPSFVRGLPNPVPTGLRGSSSGRSGVDLGSSRPPKAFSQVKWHPSEFAGSRHPDSWLVHTQ